MDARNNDQLFENISCYTIARDYDFSIDRGTVLFMHSPHLVIIHYQIDELDYDI